MAFKMKGFSGFGNSPMKKIKLKKIFKKNKNKKTEEDIAQIIARKEYENLQKLKNTLKRGSETAAEGLAEAAAGSFIGKSETLNPKTNKTTELDKPKRQPKRKPKRNKKITGIF